MSKSVFVSYNRQDGDWVWNRLVPVLKAGGGDVLVDVERFKAGGALLRQMDAVQDSADVHVLVLSEDYLASDYCVHEMERAIAIDPDFKDHVVIPVMRRDCTRPDAIRGSPSGSPEGSPVRVSMQDPRSFGSLKNFVGHLERTIREAVVFEGEPSADDLDGFFAVLDAANAALDDAGKRLLLAVDEYEMIDKKVGEGVFPEDLLATVRESVQTHRRVIWTFAGSHEITELTNLPWTSYLVSARTVEVGPFTERVEARRGMGVPEGVRGTREPGGARRRGRGAFVAAASARGRGRGRVASTGAAHGSVAAGAGIRGRASGLCPDAKTRASPQGLPAVSQVACSQRLGCQLASWVEAQRGASERQRDLRWIALVSM